MKKVMEKLQDENESLKKSATLKVKAILDVCTYVCRCVFVVYNNKTM